VLANHRTLGLAVYANCHDECVVPTRQLWGKEEPFVTTLVSANRLREGWAWEGIWRGLEEEGGAIIISLHGLCIAYNFIISEGLQGPGGGWTRNWKKEFKLPWCEAGPPNHLDDTVESDQ